MLPISRIVLMFWLLVSLGCRNSEESVSATGVSAAVANFDTDEDGHTVEQSNILKRYEMDNKRGSVKHLYIISAMSGQTILYSTVDGKVTSSSKRLTPLSVRRKTGARTISEGMVFKIGDTKYYTSEVIQDDGTFGSSVQYLYWFDVRGVYHQHYVSGGQIVHVSSEPINVKGIIINLEKESGQ